MKRLKILYISKLNSYPPLYGEQVHVYNVVKELIRLGHDVYVCDYDEHPLAKKVARSKIDDLLPHLDVLYIRQTLSNELKWTDRFIKSPRKYKVVWELNLPKYERKFAIRHLYNYSSKSVLGDIKRKLSCILDLVGVDFLWNKRKRVAKRIDGIVTVSQPLADYLKGEFFLPVAMIPNGSDCNYSFVDLYDRLTVLISGSKLPWIDWETPIQVIEKFADNRDVLFHVVDHKMEHHFGNVICHDRMPQAELKTLIGKVHVGFVFYNRYDWCPIGFYNSPLKLFEYMGNCKVIIASDMGQISDVVKHRVNGLLVEPQNYMAVCDNIQFLLDNRDIYRDIAHSAYETVKNNYSWRGVAQKTVNFIKNL